MILLENDTQPYVSESQELLVTSPSREGTPQIPVEQFETRRESGLGASGKPIFHQRHRAQRRVLVVSQGAHLTVPLVNHSEIEQPDNMICQLLFSLLLLTLRGFGFTRDDVIRVECAQQFHTRLRGWGRDVSQLGNFYRVRIVTLSATICNLHRYHAQSWSDHDDNRMCS